MYKVALDQQRQEQEKLAQLAKMQDKQHEQSMLLHQKQSDNQRFLQEEAKRKEIRD